MDVPSSVTPLLARVRTTRGREAENTLLLNTRGFIASSDSHVVEQMVAVTKHGVPLEDLTR